MGDLLSIGEAAKICGVHIATLRKWEQKGYLLPCYTMGGHRRYSKDEIESMTKIHIRDQAKGGARETM